MSFLESFSSLGINWAVIYWAAIWWLALCGVTAWLARGKGQNAVTFFAIAFFLSPVFGLLALIAARDLRGAADAQMASDDFRQLLGPALLQIDGIRGHLAVANQSPNVAPPPAAPATPPKTASAKEPPATTAPKAEPVLMNGKAPSPPTRVTGPSLAGAGTTPHADHGANRAVA